MLDGVRAALDRVYPSRTWGQPDDAARYRAGVCEHDGEALADELAVALSASTLYVPGGDEAYCDFIYVQCVGREPNLAQVVYAGVPLPDELDGGADELYLRVCLSSMAPLAAVQQTALTLVRDAGGAAIVERPRPGVYDPPLLPRMQRLVAILPAYGIAHVDFGEICAPPPGFDAGDYPARYGGEPLVVNYLFYPEPPTTVVTTPV